ncbi:MAG: galactose mutarotase [Lysobacteraceae bacterium]|nr:MAG: galactose mutarotase [Xanthomonadaceae bacterium]
MKYLFMACERKRFAGFFRRPVLVFRGMNSTMERAVNHPQAASRRLTAPWLAHAGAAFVLMSCASAHASGTGSAPVNAAPPACTVDSRPFGTLSSGEQVLAYTIRNGSIEATLLDYGGILHAIRLPDRAGRIGNVVRNLDGLAAYERRSNFSSIVGRFAGRIGGGGFTLDGVRHDLAARPDGVAIHGGPKGFGSRLWAATVGECGVDLSLRSPHGENGFPGNLAVKAAFRVAGRELRIRYTASTDRATVLNLTHHAFFNLSDAPDVYGHRLQVNADHWLPTDGRRVPTGQVAPVAGALDLRAGRQLGAVAMAGDAAVKSNNGLDHSFVLNGTHAASLSDPVSGRMLEVFTCEPGLVVFSGNGFDGSLRDAEGRPVLKGGGVALETQHFPDSPNIPAFPSTVIRPDAGLNSTTVFRFGTDAHPPDRDAPISPADCR